MGLANQSYHGETGLTIKAVFDGTLSFGLSEAGVEVEVGVALARAARARYIPGIGECTVLRLDDTQPRSPNTCGLVVEDGKTDFKIQGKTFTKRYDRICCRR